MEQSDLFTVPSLFNTRFEEMPSGKIRMKALFDQTESSLMAPLCNKNASAQEKRSRFNDFEATESTPTSAQRRALRRASTSNNELRHPFKDHERQRRESSSHQKPPKIQRRPAGVSMPEPLPQPDARPISQEQLVAEVKGIYAGLEMVEAKCIHVDKSQAILHEDGLSFSKGKEAAKLVTDRWQALIALHRTLLHEHHDFFLASQHPSASPALRGLASKYSMPARMWRHGIHSFLELLRHRSPQSLDYMLAFIYLAYQMTALLYDTVPTFEDPWIECLGDLGRYRMAIVDEDLRDRENWANVARFWYSKAADNKPTVGRLYHHLAILARPNALQQLYYYARSLTSTSLLPITQESILTLFDPMHRQLCSWKGFSAVDGTFIQFHSLPFTKSNMSSGHDDSIADFLELFDFHIARTTVIRSEHTTGIVPPSVAFLLDYDRSNSDTHNPPDSLTHGQLDSIYPVESPSSVDLGFELSSTGDSLSVTHTGDENAFPYMHVCLAFLLHSIADYSDLSQLINCVWLCKPPSAISDRRDFDVAVTGDNTAQPVSKNMPFPEVYLLRGRVWGQTLIFSKLLHQRDDIDLNHTGTSAAIQKPAECVSSLAATDDVTMDSPPAEKSNKPGRLSQQRRSFNGSVAAQWSRRGLKRVVRWIIAMIRTVSRQSSRRVQSFNRKLDKELRHFLQQSKLSNGNGLSKLLAGSLLSSLMPIAEAAAAPNGEDALLQAAPSGTFGDNSLFDSVLTAFILLALVFSWVAGKPARPFALAITLSSAVFGLLMAGGGDGVFSDHDRWTVVKTWAASTLSYISLTYSEARNGALYLLITLVVFGSFTTVGTAIQQFSPGSILNAVPPSLSLASFLASLIPHSCTGLSADDKDLEDGQWTPNPLENVRRSSQEYTDNFQPVPTTLDAVGLNDTTPQVPQRYSSPLPAPSLFEVGSDDQPDRMSTDLASQPRQRL